jgi:alanine dehydrogenase
MRVGVPREIKVQEYRVGLTPGAVREYVAAGHQLTVETGAGSGIGASDEVYQRAGASIAASARDIFAKSDMIVKVKEPQAERMDSAPRRPDPVYLPSSCAGSRTGQGPACVRLYGDRL